MEIKKTNIWIVFILLVMGCNPNYYFKNTRQKNISNKLKINGYYISHIDDRIADLQYSYKIFLYTDGAFYIGSFNSDKVESKLFKKWSSSFAGIYIIQGDEIVIERNIITDGFRNRTRTTYGRILNDTTFVADVYEDRIDTFHFVQHETKPDSTFFDKYRYIPELKQ